MTARKKSVNKTGRKTGVLVPQAHGGALLNGMAKNHVPGPGRPPDAIRAQMRELGVAKGLPFLSDLLDGKVPFTLVGTCPACGKESTLTPLALQALFDKIGASADQRLKATDQVWKHGLATKELVIASPEAAAFFDCVYRATVEAHGEQAAEAIKVRAIALADAKA